MTLLILEISLPKFGDVASFLVSGVSVSLATLLKLLDIVVSVCRRHFTADGDFLGINAITIVVAFLAGAKVDEVTPFHFDVFGFDICSSSQFSCSSRVFRLY